MLKQLKDGRKSPINRPQKSPKLYIAMKRRFDHTTGKPVFFAKLRLGKRDTTMTKLMNTSKGYGCISFMEFHKIVEYLGRGCVFSVSND